MMGVPQDLLPWGGAPTASPQGENMQRDGAKNAWWDSEAQNFPEGALPGGIAVPGGEISGLSAGSAPLSSQRAPQTQPQQLLAHP